jgi:hypothetical protein
MISTDFSGYLEWGKILHRQSERYDVAANHVIGIVLVLVTPKLQHILEGQTKAWVNGQLICQECQIPSMMFSPP